MKFPAMTDKDCIHSITFSFPTNTMSVIMDNNYEYWKETIKESSSRKTKDKDLHMNFYGDYSGPAATGPAATTINAYDDDYDEMVPRGIKSKGISNTKSM